MIQETVSNCPHLRGEGTCAIVLFCPFAPTMVLSDCQIVGKKETVKK